MNPLLITFLRIFCILVRCLWSQLSDLVQLQTKTFKFDTDTSKYPLKLFLLTNRKQNAIYPLTIHNLFKILSIYVRCPWSCRSSSNSHHSTNVNDTSKYSSKIIQADRQKKLANTFMKTNNGFPIFSRVCLFTSRHLYWPGTLLLNLTAALNMGVCDNETSKYSLKIIHVD